MKPVYVTYGPWGILIAIKNVLCSDGKRRRVRITGEADSAFTCPGSVSVKGKTVSGYVISVSGGDEEFVAYTYRKNSDLLPRW